MAFASVNGDFFHIYENDFIVDKNIISLCEMTLPTSKQDVDDNLLKYELYCKEKQWDIQLNGFSAFDKINFIDIYDKGYRYEIVNWWKNYDLSGYAFSDWGNIFSSIVSNKLESLEPSLFKPNGSVYISILFNNEKFDNNQDLQIYMRKCLKQILEFADLKDLEDSIFVNQKLINRFFKGRQVINIKGIDNYLRIGLEISKVDGMAHYDFNIRLSPYNVF